MQNIVYLCIIMYIFSGFVWEKSRFQCYVNIKLFYKMCASASALWLVTGKYIWSVFLLDDQNYFENSPFDMTFNCTVPWLLYCICLGHFNCGNEADAELTLLLGNPGKGWSALCSMCHQQPQNSDFYIRYNTFFSYRSVHFPPPTKSIMHWPNTTCINAFWWKNHPIKMRG